MTTATNWLPMKDTVLAAVEDALNTFDDPNEIKLKTLEQILREFGDMMENDLLDHSDSEIQDEFRYGGHHVGYLRHIDAMLDTTYIDRNWKGYNEMFPAKEPLNQVNWAGQVCDVIDERETEFKLRFTNAAGTCECWISKGATLHKV